MPEIHPYQRILALIHFDAFDRQVLSKAWLLARQNGAALEVLHLVEPDGALDGGYPDGGARALEQAGQRRLEFLAASLGVEVAACRALHGPRRQRLTQYMESCRPELIVTGETQAYLAGTCDVLILSQRARPQGGRLLPALRAWLGAGLRAAGS